MKMQHRLLHFITLREQQRTRKRQWSNWATTYKTLAEALLAVPSCGSIDTIFVAKGTYFRNMILPKCQPG